MSIHVFSFPTILANRSKKLVSDRLAIMTRFKEVFVIDDDGNFDIETEGTFDLDSLFSLLHASHLNPQLRLYLAQKDNFN